MHKLPGQVRQRARGGELRPDPRHLPVSGITPCLANCSPPDMTRRASARVCPSVSAMDKLTDHSSFTFMTRSSALSQPSVVTVQRMQRRATGPPAPHHGTIVGAPEPDRADRNLGVSIGTTCHW
jgi:hypothetical protein